MSWWIWVLVGIGFLAAELLAVDMAFWLVFLGAAAVLVGGIQAAFELQSGLDLLAFSVIAGISLPLFRGRLYARIVPPDSSEESVGLVGSTGTLAEPLAAGERGSVELRGSPWVARNVGPSEIAQGETFVVVKVEGIVLEIKSAK